VLRYSGLGSSDLQTYKLTFILSEAMRASNYCIICLIRICDIFFYIYDI